MWLAIVVTITHWVAPHYEAPSLKCGEPCRPSMLMMDDGLYRVPTIPQPRYLGEFEKVEDCRAAIDADVKAAKPEVEYTEMLCVPKDKTAIKTALCSSFMAQFDSNCSK